MEIKPVGRTAVLVEVADTSRALALAAWTRSRVPVGVEVVPGAQTVLLDGLAPREASALVARWPGPDRSTEAGDTGPVTLLSRYDGPDLPEVARHWGCTVEQVVERHLATVFTSAFTGFAPGFAYLAGLHDVPSLPRLDSPRTRVPAGAIALADRWCGVYPGGTPGGWLLIGTVLGDVWDVDRDEPALLAPGTRVRFVLR